jgi:hypothetical protein
MLLIFMFDVQNSSIWPNSYPLVNIYKKLLNMAIEIVSFPIKNGDFP